MDRATQAIDQEQSRRIIDPRNMIRPDLLGTLEPVDVDWLEAERTNLRLLVRMATESGHPDSAWRLARLSWRFHYIRRYFDDILEIHTNGLVSARQLNDPFAISAMHNYLASAYLRTARYQLTLKHLNAAIELRRESGDQVNLHGSLHNLAAVYIRIGRIQEAVAINRQVLRQYRMNQASGPTALVNLGMSLTLLGRLDEAIQAHRLHLRISRDRNNDFEVAQALGHIGSVQVPASENPGTRSG